MMTNKMIPQITWVSRKASAIKTGMNVPKVFKPMKLRKIKMMKAPSGSVSKILYVSCTCTGSCNNEKRMRSEDCKPWVLAMLSALIGVGETVKEKEVFSPPLTSNKGELPYCHTKKFFGKPADDVSGLR